MFSISNKTKHAKKKRNNRCNSITSRGDWILAFNIEFTIYEDCYKWWCSSELGIAYEAPNEFDKETRMTYLAGSNKFKVRDIEVYQLS